MRPIALRLESTLALVMALGATLATPAVAGPAVAGSADACNLEDGPTNYGTSVGRGWPMVMLAPERVWPLTRGQGVKVAVIDSGVAVTHPQLVGAVESGVDLVPGSKRDGTYDCDGHGTVIGGIIAARPGSNSGFVGVAPEATILPIRVLAQSGVKDQSEDVLDRIAGAITTAVERGATVINLSLASTNDHTGLRTAVANAVRDNVVVIAAAGNEGDKFPKMYPAAYPGVIAVGNIDTRGAHVATSSTGDFVDLAAPGAEIVGPAVLGGGFAAPDGGGTSFSCPYVAGTAALLRAYDPRMSAREVERRLILTADHPAGGRNDQVGYGVVNPYRAVTAVLPPEGQPAAPGQPAPIPVRAMPVDPLAGARATAVAAVVAGVTLVVLLIAAAAVVPRGRRRGWRPGRAVAGR